MSHTNGDCSSRGCAFDSVHSSVACSALHLSQAQEQLLVLHLTEGQLDLQYTHDTNVTMLIMQLSHQLSLMRCSGLAKQPTCQRSLIQMAPRTSSMHPILYVPHSLWTTLARQALNPSN